MFKTTNEKVYTLLCEQAAINSDFPKHRHSSCICYKGKVLAVGINQKKSHPLQAKFSTNDSKIWMHSEIHAIVQVLNKHGAEILKEAELYNLRLTRAGNVGISKPCPSCAKAIEAFEIGRVFWT